MLLTITFCRVAVIKYEIKFKMKILNSDFSMRLLHRDIYFYYYKDITPVRKLFHLELILGMRTDIKETYY